MTRTYSIRTVLMLLMVGEIIIAIGITGWLWYDNGNASVRSLTIDRCKEISARVENQISTLLLTASNAAKAQIDFIEADLVDTTTLKNRKNLLDYQMKFLQRNSFLSTVALGYTDGQLLGAQRDPGNSLNELYSKAGEDLLYERRIDDGELKSTPFVVKTRPWYLKANEQRRPGWTDVYEFAGTPPQLGVSAYDLIADDDSEIFAISLCDLTLGPIDTFLQKLTLTENGRSAVIETSGLLVAISEGESVKTSADGKPTRISAKNCDDQLIKETVLNLEKDLGDISSWPDRGSKEITTEIGAVLLVWRTIQSQQDIDWITLIAIPSMDLIGQISERTRWTGFAFLFLILITLPIVWRTASGITRPVQELNSGMRKISKFEIDGTTGRLSRLTELNQMQKRMEGMRHALMSFEKYVPSRVVRQLVTEDRVAVPGMEEATACVFFSDVIGFTGIAETLEPEKLVQLGGEYLQEMSQQIIDHSGIVDKFIGDAIMAFWIAEVDGSRVTSAACKAALDSQKQLNLKRKEWKNRNLPQLRARIGLHTGPVLVGNIGSDNRLNYTVLGDTVNLASRLEGLNRIYDTEIIVSEEISTIVAKEMHCRIIDHVAVKGRRKGGAIYELVCPRDQMSEIHQEIDFLHHEALKHYQSGNFEIAADGFSKLQTMHPDDGPSKALLQRCKSLIVNPPENWAGYSPLDRNLKET
ncbi:MAG: adenylate/guanylate cyclase domain-containing protein [Planctomycetota bacterium]